MDFAGATVVVTGASGALGTAIVRTLLEHRARVTAVARGAVPLNALAAAVGRPAELTLVPADASTPEGAEAAVAGGCDVLVHAVGSWAGGTALEDAPDAQLDAMLGLNFRSAWLCARAALRKMVAAGRGRLVFVGSTAGLVGLARSAAYAASKAAVHSLVVSIAAEGAPRGIACNAVAPGTMDTEANRRAMPNADRTRWVKTEEVARVIAFLASSDAAGVTGTIIPVSRGA